MPFLATLSDTRPARGWLAALRAAIERWLVGRYES